MIKRKTLIILLGIIAIFACFAAACSNDFNPDKDISKDYVKVYLDYNGGKSAANSSLKGATVYVKKGSKINYEGLQNFNGKNLIPTNYGYVLDGFAYGEVNEDGEVVFERYPTGEIRFWDFDRTVLEELTLYAYWSQAYTVNIITPDDKVNTSYVLSEASPTITSIRTSSVSGYTIINFEVFSDKEFKNPVTFPYTHQGAATGSDEMVVNLYVNWIEGSYTIVRTASEFRSAMNNGVAIYLWNDIDLEGNPIGVTQNYNSEFYGNGKTVKNFKKVENPRGVNAVYLGIFANIGSEANIHDVTFENIEITLTSTGTPSQFYAGIFAGQIAADAEFKGVNLNNVTVTYKVRDGYFEQYPERRNIGTVCGNEKSGDNADGVEITGVTLNNCSIAQSAD